MEYTVKNNEKEQRFEIDVEGHIAFVQYETFDGGISYTSTVVPPEMGGKGIAAHIVKHALEYAAEHNLKVEPRCPYVKSYIDRHPEYQANSLFHS